MSNERDQGLSAIQRGDYDVAATLLETACRENPDDFQAHLYLGGAYHQLKRSNDAVRVLVRATQLQPASAQARYNLGIALEQAGRHVEAVASLQNALALQPDYPAAQQAIQRIQTPAPPQTPAYAQENAYAPPAAYGQPASPLYGQTQQFNQPQAVPGLNAPPPLNAPGAYNQTAQPLNQPYGQAPAPLYGGQPNYGSPGYSPSTAPGQGPYGYPAQQGAGGYGPGGPRPYANYPNSGVNSTYSDSFDIGQAGKDLFQILTSPVRFFSEQAGCEGMQAPISMLAIFLALAMVSSIIGLATSPNHTEIGLPFIIGFVIGMVIVYGLMIVVYLFLAGVLHLVGKLAGNTATFSGSFRASVYATVPLIVLNFCATLLSPILPGSIASATPIEPEHRVALAQYNPPSFPSGPGMQRGFGAPQMPTFRGPGIQRGFSAPTMRGPGMQPFGGGVQSPGFPNNRGFGTQPFGGGGIQQPNFTNPGMAGAPMNSPIPFGRTRSPITLAATLIGFIWTIVLVGIAVCHIQRVSAGAAVAIVIGAGIIDLIVFVVIVLLLAAVVGTAVAALMGSR